MHERAFHQRLVVVGFLLLFWIYEGKFRYRKNRQKRVAGCNASLMFRKWKLMDARVDFPVISDDPLSSMVTTVFLPRFIATSTTWLT